MLTCCVAMRFENVYIVASPQNGSFGLVKMWRLISNIYIFIRNSNRGQCVRSISRRHRPIGYVACWNSHWLHSIHSYIYIWHTIWTRLIFMKSVYFSLVVMVFYFTRVECINIKPNPHSTQSCVWIRFLGVDFGWASGWLYKRSHPIICLNQSISADITRDHQFTRNPNTHSPKSI